MTTPEYDPATLNRGVLSYAENGKVAHGIILLDPVTGQKVEVLAGIMLTPEIARKVAMNLTIASIKAEEDTK